MSKIMKEFKEFASRGNIIDLAIGIAVGSAFGVLVQSLVSDLIMPPIGLLLGEIDFSNLFVVLKSGNPPGPYLTLTSAKDAGAVTINYGLFVSHLVSFLIIAFTLFLVVRTINQFQRKEEAPSPTTKECPYCHTNIPIQAIRCPNCTSQL